MNILLIVFSFKWGLHLAIFFELIGSSQFLLAWMIRAAANASYGLFFNKSPYLDILAAISLAVCCILDTSMMFNF
jgi:hypothetical protein